jgi:hypothetical protein
MVNVPAPSVDHVLGAQAVAGVSEDVTIDLVSGSSDEEGGGPAAGVSRAPVDVDNFIMDAWEVLVGRTLKPDPDSPPPDQALGAAEDLPLSPRPPSRPSLHH